jgi:hypothetical protein
MDFDCEEIHCISLSDREEKRKYFLNMANELNLDFSFFDAIRDKEKPYRGCFRSHFKIISDSYKNNIQRLMILEDDNMIRKNITKDEIKTINRFLNRNKDWELFLLGGTANIWNGDIIQKTKYKNIYKGSFLGTYAYILSRKGIEKYKNVKWGKPYKYIDKDITSKNKELYAYMPELYEQRPIQNDIGNNSIVFIKFRTKILDFCNWYTMNINISIYYILFFIIISVIIIIKRK